MTSALQRSIYCSQVMNLLRSLINFSLNIESSSVLLATGIWQDIANKAPSNSNFTVNSFLSNIIVEKLDQLKSR